MMGLRGTDGAVLCGALEMGGHRRRCWIATWPACPPAKRATVLQIAKETAMATQQKPELLFLHALPLDGSMWAGQKDLLPGATHMPNLYPFGDSVQAWAAAALSLVTGNRLIVVGCSVGGSCAIEVAVAAPERIAALVLIGTKAAHRPDPALHASALGIIRDQGLDHAWARFWSPLFSRAASSAVIGDARRAALRQSPRDVARGVTAFHSRPSRDQFLAAFPRPVIIVTGAEDRMPGPEASAAQARSTPQGRLHIVQDCGHYVPLERPGPLNLILRDLIAAR
ncbi:alpha/beta fold hydrolase [Humitalea sp. 24SJ18S-53]|uniref:alpha/beta fold hydrolase n=1 Tax=Humitalea sp. 24SJ18S-53 TaxID=3422307 RepID=UPI003D665CA9